MGICINLPFSEDKKVTIVDTDKKHSIEKNKPIQPKLEYNQFNDDPILCSVPESCYLCKKTIQSTSQKMVTCLHCNRMIGHKSCVQYRMLLTPNCPYCSYLITSK